MAWRFFGEFAAVATLWLRLADIPSVPGVRTWPRRFRAGKVNFAVRSGNAWSQCGQRVNPATPHRAMALSAGRRPLSLFAWATKGKNAARIV